MAMWRVREACEKPIELLYHEHRINLPFITADQSGRASDDVHHQAKLEELVLHRGAAGAPS